MSHSNAEKFFEAAGLRRASRSLQLCRNTSILLLAGLVNLACANSYKFIELPPLDGYESSGATGINIIGEVVGASYHANGMLRANIWSAETNNAVELGTLGGSRSYALALSNSGKAIGWSDLSGDVMTHATGWRGVVKTDLGSLGGSSQAFAFGPSGKIVGWSYVKDEAYVRATQWQSGVLTDLGTLGGQSSASFSINSSGQVVGWSNPLGNEVIRPVRWTGGEIMDLGTLGGAGGEAYGINDHGTIVGRSQIPGGTYHATRWQETKKAVDLGTLGGANSTAFKVNGRGQIVGWSEVAGETQHHAFLWFKGKMIDLNTQLDSATRAAGWVLTDATNINDNGQIVGSAFNQTSGKILAYKLTPK